MKLQQNNMDISSNTENTETNTLKPVSSPPINILSQQKSPSYVNKQYIYTKNDDSCNAPSTKQCIIRI